MKNLRSMVQVFIWKVDKGDMKKRVYTGINLGADIQYSIRPEQADHPMKTGLSHLGYYCFLFLFTGLMTGGTWGMLSNSLGITDQARQTGIITGICVLCVILFLQVKLKWYLKTVFLGGAAGLCVWWLREAIGGGIAMVTGRIGVMVNAYYRTREGFPDWQGELSPVFKAAVLIFLALWVCFFCIRVRRVVLAGLPGILIFLQALLLGVVCGKSETVCFLLGFIGMMAMRKHRWMTGERRVILKALLPVSAILAAAVLFQLLMTEKNQVPDQAERLAMRGKIEEFFDLIWKNSRSNEDQDTALYSSGGLSGGNLKAAGNLNYQGKDLLRIEVDEEPTDKIYLRGYAGDTYARGEWNYNGGGRFAAWYREEYLGMKEFAAEDGVGVVYQSPGKNSGNLLSLPYYALQQKAQGRMDIQVLNDIGAYQVMPYTALIDFEQIVSNDSFLLPKDQNYGYTYVKEFYSLSNDMEALRSAIGESPFAADELKYRKYIYDTALQIPSDLTLLKSAYSVSGENLSLDEVIQSVRTELFSRASYTLSPGSVPEGWDPIEYFLFQNMQGYCMHFASAGTLLFRLHGIPARYVEGFVLRPAEFKETPEGRYEAVAQDYQSHAWVEIYLNALGWVPVEVTPGFEGDMSEAISNLGAAAEAEREENAPEEAESEPKPEEPKKKPEEQEKKGMSWLKIGAIAVISFFLLIAGFFVRYQICQRRKQTASRVAEVNERVCGMSESLREFLALAGLNEEKFPDRQKFIQEVKDQYQAIDTDDFTTYLSLTEKAAYSRSILTEKEYKLAVRVYEGLRDEIYQSYNKFQRFLVKYWKCM